MTVTLDIQPAFVRSVGDGGRLVGYNYADSVSMLYFPSDIGPAQNTWHMSHEEYEGLRQAQPTLELPELKPRKPGTQANGNTLGSVVGETPSTAAKAQQANPEVKPETPKEESWWGSWGSSVTHTVLDIGGAIPVVGIFSDGINAGIYAAEGDMVNAALSGVSAAANLIPGGGAATKAGKLAYTGGKMALKKAEKELAEKLVKEQLEKEAAERLAKDRLEKEIAEKAARDAEEAAARKGGKEAEAEAGGGGGSKKKDSTVKKGKKPKCGGRATYGRQGGDFLEHEMERDHIPNVASLKAKAWERIAKLEEELSDSQIDALFGKKGKNGQRGGGKIYNHAQTIAVPKDIHRASPTTGNRENAKDAKNLADAAKRDTKNHRDNIAKSDKHKDCLGAVKEASEVIDKISNDQYNKFLDNLIDDVLKGKSTTNPWKGIL